MYPRVSIVVPTQDQHNPPNPATNFLRGIVQEGNEFLKTAIMAQSDVVE